MPRFSDLTASIQDAWVFLLLPLIQCLAIYLISHSLNPSGTHVVIQQSLTALGNAGTLLSDTMNNKALDIFGLRTVIPVISVVALLAFLFLLRGPTLNLISSVLPPQVVFREDVFVLQKFPESHSLLIMHHYPEAASFSEAYQLACLDAGRPEANERYWMNRSANGAFLQGLAKFALVVAVVIAFLDVKVGDMPFGSQLAKLLPTVIVILLVWIIGVLAIVSTTEQALFEKVHRIIRSLKKEPVNPTPASSSDTAMVRLDLGRRWWWLQFSSYSLTWLRQILWPSVPTRLGPA